MSLNLKTAATLLLFSMGLVSTGLGQDQPGKRDTTGVCDHGKKLLAEYRFEEALQPLKVCYQNTKDIGTLRKIADCHYKLGQFKEAKAAYHEVLKLDSTQIVAMNKLAGIYIRESNYKGALAHYRKLATLDSTNSYYHKQLARVHYKTGNIPMAIAKYKKAGKLNSTDVEVITDLAKIYQKLELFPAADSLIRAGLSYDSSNTRLLQLKAESAYKQKDYGEVVSSLATLLYVQNDSSAYVLKLLGVSLFHTGQHQDAIKMLERVEAGKQATEVIHYYLGLAYRETGQPGKSIEQFENAIDLGISGNLSTYYTNLAVTFEENKNFEESIKAYKAAYGSSKNQTLLYHLARNYDKYYKNKETALMYYEKYLAMTDSGNTKFHNYSKHRISELKEIVHFELDSLD